MYKSNTGHGNLSIWLAIILGFGVRASLLFAVGDLDCQNDECSYLNVAGALLEGRGLVPVRGFLWAPGYPAFLALAGAQQSINMALAAKILQVGLALGTHLLLVAWAKRCFGTGAAIGTAWLYALYPTLVAFTHYLWPETLYIFFLVLGFWALSTASDVDHKETRSHLHLLGSGVSLGLAALVRPIAFHFLPLVALWLFWWNRSRLGGLRPVAVFVLGCILTIGPWTISNWTRYERIVPIDATLGVNLWRGNGSPAVANWDFGFDRRPRNATIPRGFPECLELSVIDRDRCNTLVSLRIVREDPGRFLRRVPTKILDLANPTSFLIRHARWGKYGTLSQGSIALLTFLVVVSTAMVGLLSTLGLVAMPAWFSASSPAAKSRQLTLTLLAYTLAVHSVTFGMSRYRLPLIPFLLPFVAIVWSRRHDIACLSSYRRCAALVLWVFLLACWTRRLPVLLDLDPAITGPPTMLRPILTESSPRGEDEAVTTAISLPVHQYAPDSKTEPTWAQDAKQPVENNHED